MELNSVDSEVTYHPRQIKNVTNAESDVDSTVGYEGVDDVSDGGSLDRGDVVVGSRDGAASDHLEAQITGLAGMLKDVINRLESLRVEGHPIGSSTTEESHTEDQGYTYAQADDHGPKWSCLHDGPTSPGCRGNRVTEQRNQKRVDFGRRDQRASNLQDQYNGGNQMIRVNTGHQGHAQGPDTIYEDRDARSGHRPRRHVDQSRPNSDKRWHQQYHGLPTNYGPRGSYPPPHHNFPQVYFATTQIWSKNCTAGSVP